ncbi:hypothetical protein BSLA_01r0905 [Burkholderia stabilis]|nr:hypothetical protein BSLA_01r0905 [Burkholderia stabilis]
MCDRTNASCRFPKWRATPFPAADMAGDTSKRFLDFVSRFKETYTKHGYHRCFPRRRRGHGRHR